MSDGINDCSGDEYRYKSDRKPVGRACGSDDRSKKWVTGPAAHVYAKVSQQPPEAAAASPTTPAVEELVKAAKDAVKRINNKYGFMAEDERLVERIEAAIRKLEEGR